MSSNIKVQRICQHCNKEFTARTTVTRYCSDDCAKKAYKAKKRDEKVEDSNKETQFIRTKPMEDLKVKEFLTITEACRILSLSRWTIWRAIKNEELIAAKIGRRVLIRHSDLDMLFKIEINSGPEKIKEEQRPNDPTNTDTGNFNIADSYTLTEVQNKYGISESALQHLIKRNNVPKIKQGWFAYVPKKVIDTLLT